MINALKINAFNSSIACIATEAATIYAVFMTVNNYINPAWWIISLVFYMAVQLSVSVGLHRYYTHRSFECHKFWQYVFAIIGTLSFHGSPISFIHAHHTHHKYADTDRDSHVTGWKFFIFREYKVKSGMNSRLIIKLTKDPMQMLLLNYGALLCFLVFIILYLISPLISLFCYAVPVGIYFFFTAVHQTISHSKYGARDMQWLEFIMPICEWRHAYHHKNPSEWDWGRLDIGSYFIRSIKT
jgi:fatty-acid desaturase